MMVVTEESSWSPPPQNREEEQSPLSDSEHEQGPILPAENQRNKKCNEVQKRKTMQDNYNNLLGQWNHQEKKMDL